MVWISEDKIMCPQGIYHDPIPADYYCPTGERDLNDIANKPFCRNCGKRMPWINFTNWIVKTGFEDEADGI